jgi:hypothetical protein
MSERITSSNVQRESLLKSHRAARGTVVCVYVYVCAGEEQKTNACVCVCVCG